MYLSRTCLLVALLVLCSSNLLANPTGAPLVSYPIEPCRILDTRVSIGAIPTHTAIDVFVRGSALQSSDGAQLANCGVPTSAEAVLVNVTAVFPSSTGDLLINGTGRVAGLNGAYQYSRVTYMPGTLLSNEIQVSLCNTYLYPSPHSPCPHDGVSRYRDFQILNLSSTGSSVHVVVQVVGYLERMPGS